MAHEPDPATQELLQTLDRITRDITLSGARLSLETYQTTVNAINDILAGYMAGMLEAHDALQKIAEMTALVEPMEGAVAQIVKGDG